MKKTPAQKYIVAAYATTPSLEAWNLEAPYFAALAACPHISGIEHPFLPHTNKYPLPWLRDHVPPHWSMIITALPSLMHHARDSPWFGIASTHEKSRQQAVVHVSKILDYAYTLQHAFGRPVVTAVHLHTSPTNNHAQIRGNKIALKQSLLDISAMNWGTIQVNLEHCDAYTPAQLHAPEKGFLGLEDEIEVIQAVKALGGLDYGIVLNWARSAIETHSITTPLEHIRLASNAQLLAGFFFSGCTNQDNHAYGNWKDTHMPPQALCPQSLLDHDAIHKIYAMLNGTEYLGIKISQRPHNPLDWQTATQLNTQTVVEQLSCFI